VFFLNVSHKALTPERGIGSASVDLLGRAIGL